PADLLGNAAGAGDGGSGKHERELLAAEASREVELAKRSRQHGCDAAEDVVAALMTETVVHLLEVVDVDEDERHVGLVPPRAIDLFPKPIVEGSPVGEAGQLVALGAFAEVAEHAGQRPRE